MEEISRLILIFEQALVLCSIWDDVRTYLTSSIDPKEKAALLAAIAHFKKKEGERA